MPKRFGACTIAQNSNRIGVLAIAICLGACQPHPGDEDVAPILRQIGPSSGFQFTHVNGMSGQYYIAEVMGAGAAFLDYDNDGDLDVYMVQGGSSLLQKGESELSRIGDRLFRNDLRVTPGGIVLAFTDVTEVSGIRAFGYGMGIAVGDYDRDGLADIYLSNFGNNELWRNNGDGTFSDRTSMAGVNDPALSTSALFLDYDQDGWLDLLVGNYVNFSARSHKICRRSDTAPDYCGPQSFEPVADRLFRNQGDGSFLDVTVESGMMLAGANLGATAADFDGDGWTDVFVANDAMENFLWINQGNGTFANEGLSSGVAVNARGEREASMGIALGDFDNDLDLDIFLSHLGTETNTLYANDGTGYFVDVTRGAGLATPSLPFTGFGTGWLDFDRDGWLDVLVVNGAVRTIPEQEAAGDPLPLKEADQLFRNSGAGQFEEIELEALRVEGVSRGATFGDIDNDGDTDVLITNNNGPARLLLNESPGGKYWLGVILIDKYGGAAQGAQAILTDGSGRKQLRAVSPAGSYLSSNDPRLLFGLTNATGKPQVLVRWPGGKKERWSDLERNQYHILNQGSGAPVEH